jgi:flagellar protein FlgJ
MEIAGLGSMHLDNLRSTSVSAANNLENFADILERAAAREQRSVEPEPLLQNLADTRTASSILSTRAAPIDKNDELYQLCLELETFIVKILINGMRNSVQKSGLIDDSFAGKMYEDLLYDEYAKIFTRNANFGLAEQAYRQLRGIRG